MTTLPPGPDAPAVVQTVRLSRDPIGTLAAARRRYGDVFTLRLTRVGPLVVVAAPDAVGPLLEADPAGAAAGTARRRLLAVLPPASVLGADGAEHRTARARLAPAFAVPRLERLTARFAAVAGAHAARWPVGRPFALLPRVRALALDVFVREVLAVRDRRRADALARAVRRMVWSPVAAPGLWSPDPDAGAPSRAGWALYRLLRRPVAALVREEVAARRRAGAHAAADPHDALSALVDVDDDVVVDEAVGLLIAGHERIGAGLTWMLERLARHPAVAERILQERGTPSQTLRAAILETLASRPAIIDAARRLTAPLAVAGHRLPAGTAVMVGIPAVHGLGTERGLDAFEPDRFGSGAPGCPFVPFGGGERTCLGADLTMIEAAAVVPAVLERLRLAPAGRPERPALRGTALVPHRGGRVVATPRRAHGVDPVGPCR